MFGRRKVKPIKYDPCPMCDSTLWLVKGNGELFIRYNREYIRRPHQCGGCGVRVKLVRRLSDDTWHTSIKAA